MRLKAVIVLLLGLFLAGGLQASNKESEMVNKFLKQTQEKRTQKLSWFSAHFMLNRINRHNEYNTFADLESANVTGASLSWLGEAKSFGVDMGIIARQRFALSLGGEYWTKLGDNLTGPFNYAPTGTTVEKLTSQVSVYAVTAGVQFYPLSHPSLVNQIEGLSFRLGGTVGWYHATWDLWQEYRSLNLSTSSYESENIPFTGSSIGLAAVVGADYPLGWKNFAIGLEAGYLYLNFNNIAWYNSSDDEVVVTYNGASDGRVDLNLSGIRAKFEFKRYFSW